MEMNKNNIYHPTGNEQISIPTLFTDGRIENINFISMRHRGLIEIDGDSDQNPLLRPVLRVNGESFTGIWKWQREAY